MKYCNTKLIPLAQAILSDGRLWGRILTSTGVNLGGGGLVAGVRGTSVSVERVPSTSQYTIAVIDSVNHGTTIETAAATLSAIAGVNISGTLPSILHTGSQISVNAITPGQSYITSSPSTKTSLLTNSAWIRDNTRADIGYLYTNSGVTPRVLAEYNATISSATPPTILDALCPDVGSTTRSYWTSLIPYTRYLDKCRESTLLAFADYTGSTSLGNTSPTTLGVASPLIFSGSSILATGIGSRGVDGYSITAIGQYISYVIGEFDRIGGLAGKKIMIELGSAVGSQSTIAGQTKFYIADFGDNLKVLKSGSTYQCMWRSSPFACTQEDIIQNTDTKLIIILPNITPTQMIIGNVGVVGNTQYDKPIGTTIKSIRIQ